MKAFILAGGQGSRLWPLSQDQSPKQFLNLGLSQFSLLQETCLRLRHQFAERDIYVGGLKGHQQQLHQQMQEVLPNASFSQIITEPARKNTAAATLQFLLQMPKDEIVVVASADHLIQPLDSFTLALQQAYQLAQKGHLVTIGLKPAYPATGYGYIQIGQALDEGFLVKKFVEKPDYDTAKKYLESEKYLWNVGIFIAKVSSFRHAFELYEPEMFQTLQNAIDQDESARQLAYQAVKSISLDYAICEKSDNMATVIGKFNWEDLGTWSSIYHTSEKDSDGNVCYGQVATKDAFNNCVVSTQKQVACVGVKDLVIVDCKEALLVADINQPQAIREVAKQVEESLKHDPSQRPWGFYEVLSDEEDHKVKKIVVYPDKRLSYQSHQKRAEHWFIVSGQAVVTLDDEEHQLSAGQAIDIPRGSKHRIANYSDKNMTFIEVQTGNYFGEDDIERYEDDYGRSSDKTTTFIEEVQTGNYFGEDDIERYRDNDERSS